MALRFLRRSTPHIRGENEMKQLEPWSEATGILKEFDSSEHILHFERFSIILPLRLYEELPSLDSFIGKKIFLFRTDSKITPQVFIKNASVQSQPRSKSRRDRSSNFTFTPGALGQSCIRNDALSPSDDSQAIERQVTGRIEGTASPSESRAKGEVPIR